ncbi:head GIN domain-containing protein [Daejeonella lutea]|uniref:Putative auto-transporter adhesin, head GIN domain n=1 Tax=Daejeonella lutea TaxID=572036 RepID=A0A1T5EFT7_9SPHI|nr:head GIN domain-containing protein [Daejeonella lutea]SKB82947.1 Putative auto-transporter adhesin, head GIN domain [Daejeonella lutea]
MKVFKTYLAILALLVASSHVDSYAALITVVNSTKSVADETRNVSGFTGITSAGSYNVTITMGNTESLKLEGDADQIADIETVVENGILKIRNKKSTGSWKNSWSGKVNIYVNAKSLKSITLSGSGDINVKGTVKSSDVTTTLSGSGSITLTVDATNYLATISGSGEIKASGRAENAKINVNGSGGFEGNSLRTNVTSARVSGSGDISVNANKSLEAAMSGSGNIRYSGSADVKSSKSGSGRISKL